MSPFSVGSEQLGSCNEVGQSHAVLSGDAALWLVLFGILLGPTLIHLSSQMPLPTNGGKGVSDRHRATRHGWEKRAEDRFEPSQGDQPPSFIRGRVRTRTDQSSPARVELGFLQVLRL